MKEKVVIIGGGPAGLFCAFGLLQRGFQVELYEQMSGVAKKFLIAGNGGLNLTHSESLDVFVTRFGKNQSFFKELICNFSPEDLRLWCDDLNVETFIGSSGRVFPKKLKAGDILIKWLDKLKSHENFRLFLNHKLISLKKDKTLVLENNEGGELEIISKKIVFALGGASWKKTGSNGLWRELFLKLDINVKEFLPMNCGFETTWSSYFINKLDRTPLKNISVKVGAESARGELMITDFGLEGGAIYALSNFIRDEINRSGFCDVFLDLKPDMELEVIKEKILKNSKKQSMANHLRKKLGIKSEEYTLLKELCDNTKLFDRDYLSSAIKNLKIKFTGIRPIDEAISSGGGVCFSGLTENLEVEKFPGIYIIGEMLDFEAPTGGYLLQGCFSTAFRVSQRI